MLARTCIFFACWYVVLCAGVEIPSLHLQHEAENPGILIKYAKLKLTCQDQVAPFEGLWGFDNDQG